VVFHRLLQTYRTIAFIATLQGGLSMVVLNFDEFHATHEPGHLEYAASLLAGSAVTAIFIKVLALVLLLMFDGNDEPTVQDLVLALVPFVLLLFGVAQYLLGLLFWYAAVYSPMLSTVVAGQVALLSAATLFLLTLFLSRWLRYE